SFDSPHSILYPHSFPTRRSSDLMAYALLPKPDGGGYFSSLYLKRQTERRRLSLDSKQTKQSKHRKYSMPNMGSLEKGRAPSTRQDRKSTRLNSSHGSISYAVFCL